MKGLISAPVIGVIWMLTVLTSCNSKSEEPNFEIGGTSQILLINTTEDSLDYRIRDNALWPEKAYYLVATIGPGESILQERKAQGRNDFYFSIEDEEHNLYSTPGAIDTLTIHAAESGKIELEFAGSLQSVNEFLYAKTHYFGTSKSDRKGRSECMLDNTKSFEEVFAFNDSLTQVNKNYLKSNIKGLPDWYVKFENKRLDYVNAWYKMNAVFYRKMTLRSDEKVPAEFVKFYSENVELQCPSMLGNRDYMNFLYQYITFKIDFNQTEVKTPNRNISRKGQFENRIKMIETELDGLVKEAYLASELAQCIDRKVLYDVAWLDKIQNPEFRSFLDGVESYYDHH
ncbi:hypothetical protein [Reichenbachiella ulvae]|uniref:Uncharacterized protein n=1 Tax=Reichenbachiella ulvae TaxID=2980104 RepID=A0ABT3CNF1_9BACT|nr:hypothetical protein [Reichenbachiella ulvae]MCV9385265.1 hypothetical protein [Reichenbachiella ulvae]